jgi:hypothetical protein
MRRGGASGHTPALEFMDRQPRWARAGSYEDPIADAVSELDRAYFARHPERTYYVRLKIEGEWNGRLKHLPATDELRTEAVESRYTLVEQIPGGRLRHPLPGWWNPDEPVVLFMPSPNGTVDGYLAVGTDDIDEVL